MSPAACAHGDLHIAQRVCGHLWRREADSYAHRFTGRGLAYDLLCVGCVEQPAGDAEDLVTVCAACFEEMAEAGSWTSGERAVVSQPAIAERATRLSFSHEMIRLPVARSAPLLDCQALPAGDGQAATSRWLGVTSAGTLVLIDLHEKHWMPIAELAGAGVDLEHQLALHVSPDGLTAAVVEDRGLSGVVVELATGDITMMIDRGPHLVERARFPLAFVRHAGEVLLVHATAWNRLDALDPRPGACVSTRPGGPGEALAHNVEYVSSSLTASPDGAWMADNGFTASATGMVAAFRLGAWLGPEGNRWEADDGPTKRYLCQRRDFWNGPLAWVAPGTLAVWGYGPGRASLVPAVILFDVESGEALRWFAGPHGEMVFDEWLFSLGDGDGVSVWDVATGERLLHDAGFQPLRYHAGTRQFLTPSTDGALFVVSRLVGDPGSP
jgi:hypothetical protein